MHTYLDELRKNVRKLRESMPKIRQVFNDCGCRALAPEAGSAATEKDTADSKALVQLNSPGGPDENLFREALLKTGHKADL